MNDFESSEHDPLLYPIAGRKTIRVRHVRKQSRDRPTLASELRRISAARAYALA
jgi:hypothetical protein